MVTRLIAGPSRHDAVPPGIAFWFPWPGCGTTGQKYVLEAYRQPFATLKEVCCLEMISKSSKPVPQASKLGRSGCMFNCPGRAHLATISPARCAAPRALLKRVIADSCCHSRSLGVARSAWHRVAPAPGPLRPEGACSSSHHTDVPPATMCSQMFDLATCQCSMTARSAASLKIVALFWAT